MKETLHLKPLLVKSHQFFLINLFLSDGADVTVAKANLIIITSELFLVLASHQDISQNHLS